MKILLEQRDGAREQALFTTTTAREALDKAEQLIRQAIAAQRVGMAKANPAMVVSVTLQFSFKMGEKL